MLPLDLSTHSGVSKNDPLGPVPAKPLGNNIFWKSLLFGIVLLFSIVIVVFELI